MNEIKSKGVMSGFSLVMINVIAVDSLRTLPISAEYGLPLIFFYLLAGLTFFVPIALIAAELATGWPKTGGIYVWVSEAFGPRMGFLTVWLQWVYNIVWYPTILAFLAAAIAYLFKPSWAEHTGYMLATILALFWLATFVNCFGMRVSSWISTIGAILGTLIPMALIVGLGITWIVQGHPTQITMNWHALLPTQTSWDNLAFFNAILFGLIGIEMSAVHAESVKNPRRDYPRALLYSTIIILSSLMLASLAIAIVVPANQLSLVSGLNDAFMIFFRAYHLDWMVPLITAAIILGSLGGMSAWIIGPTKALLAATKEGCLPQLFNETNRHDVPVKLLLLQGVIVTLMCFLFLLFPSINSSYWILSALTAQLALLMYILMFAAAIKLRYSKPDIKRTFKIPGGNTVMWIVAGVGIIACVVGIVVGFLLPDAIKMQKTILYQLFLLMGVILFCVPPFWFYRKSSALVEGSY